MKMVAASKLRRAQERVIAARPFAQQMQRVLNSSWRASTRRAPAAGAAAGAGPGATLLIVITADRGLCGSFNTNVIKAAGQFIVAEGPTARWRSGWWAARGATSSAAAASCASSRSASSRS
jgi:F-type H+-transporting ATPase subunit gamma